MATPQILAIVNRLVGLLTTGNLNLCFVSSKEQLSANQHKSSSRDGPGAMGPGQIPV